MGAHVFPFPPPAIDRCRALASAAAVVADRLADQHGPVLIAASDLLGIDDTAFARRLDLMKDAEGGQLLRDLGAALQHAASDLDLAARAIFLMRARLAAGIGSHGGFDER